MEIKKALNEENKNALQSLPCGIIQMEKKNNTWTPDFISDGFAAVLEADRETQQEYYYLDKVIEKILPADRPVFYSMLEKKDASEKLVEYAKCFPFAEITVGYPQRTLLVYNEFVYDLVDVDPLGRYVPVSEAKLHDAYWISNFHRKKFGDPLLNPIVGETSSSPSVGAVVEDITECRRVWFRPYYSFIRNCIFFYTFNTFWYNYII